MDNNESAVIGTTTANDTANLAPLVYWAEDSDGKENERMVHTMFLWGVYMLLFIPFMLCWNALVRSLRKRRYLSERQADTLVECAEESVRERMNGIRLASMLGNNTKK